MASRLHFKFDPNQDYQLEAIQSIVRVLDGLPRTTSEFALGDEVVPNLPPAHTLSESWLHDNVLAIQEEAERQGVAVDRSLWLEVDEGLVLEGVGLESWRYPSFTVEMETGTGKTYVYLRTVHELRRRYAFRKFIVVVPSIAIYEGVIKHFQVTRGHFRALYGNEPVNLVRYDGSRLSTLRAFAASTFVEILVMTIDSFNKQTNVLFKPSEQLPGERLPYQYVQETRPILILDEPQNMESPKSREALRTLHPLLALRYSATHRTTPNLVYRLTPFEAYRRGLVKRIQVDGVTQRDDLNRPFLALRTISRKGAISATVRTYASAGGRVREMDVTLRHGDDLYAKTGREEHQAGYRVAEIHAGGGYLQFENGLTLHRDETVGPSRPEVFRVQIERTVERHMEWQQELIEKGIKVLSLFFIDRVANYVADDGIIRRLFDEAFERYKRRFPYYQALEARQVRDAYFAKQKVKGADAEVAIDTDGRNQAEREAEKRAFVLIMRDKERLLSFDEPVCFIFAHSALKEGWDSSNVFQICTLNQTVSEMKKRQEIGRGLRLAVNQEGDRVFDEDVNILTVVANESYNDYVRTLQSEYAEDGQVAPPPPSRAGKAVAQRNEAVFSDARFLGFWERLRQRTHYRLNVDTPALVEVCVERLNNVRFPEARIVIERGAYVQTELSLILESVSESKAKITFKTRDTLGDERSETRSYPVGADLAKVLKEPRLKGFRLSKLAQTGEPAVLFDNDTRLGIGQPAVFHSEAGQAAVERAVLAPQHSYPVFNLLDRAAKETGLTRPTINTIYRRLSDRKKAGLLKNPEGFAAVFIAEIQNALADHVVERLEFCVEGGARDLDLEELFPEQRHFPQKELVPAGERGLYDQVQKDSDVEERFVRNCLQPDDRVIGYFKFPPAFKVPLPKILGNYNPDWGILRYGESGQVVLQLVRETKGGEDLRSLQFPRERRKVEAARKHFREIGVDYRVVTDETPGWWRPGDEVPLPRF